MCIRDSPHMREIIFPQCRNTMTMIYMKKWPKKGIFLFIAPFRSPKIALCKRDNIFIKNTNTSNSVAHVNQLKNQLLALAAWVFPEAPILAIFGHKIPNFWRFLKQSVSKSWNNLFIPPALDNQKSHASNTSVLSSQDHKLSNSWATKFQNSQTRLKPYSIALVIKKQ